jgi:uroporphyrinogen III methyltransferase/synthase
MRQSRTVEAGGKPGVVYLVGAGPGDPALITRRGAELLERAQVVIYDGLVNTALLDLAPADARRLYAGKKRAADQGPMTQDQICAAIVAEARAGHVVVRLKGGDPFVFGRGAEEIAALEQAGIGYEVVPGVTAATAVAAYAGIPLTARGVSSTVAFATGHEQAGKPDSDVDWIALARAGTVVLFMALKTARDCTERLIAAGKSSTTPAAAIHWGTTAAQRTVVAPLGDLADAIEAAHMRPPALLVIGEVVGLRNRAGSWFETRPLFGQRVLITRNVDRAGDFAHVLADVGAEPIVCPVTRIVREVDDAELARVLGGLGDYDWVVFTSANAVERFFDELLAAGGDVRRFAAARIACVGPVTAAALGDRLRADLIPARGDATGVAAAVIEAAGAAIAGLRVLVPRAAEGRDEAVTALRAAGAEVDLLPLYATRTVAADDPTSSYGIELLRSGGIGVAAFFAPSQVRAVFELLGDDAAALLRRCALIAAIGNATAAALEQRGVPVDVVPSRPDARTLATEIAAAFASTEDGAPT